MSTLEDISICVYELSKAMGFVILPLALIDSVVRPFLNAIAVPLLPYPFSSVCCSVRESVPLKESEKCVSENPSDGYWTLCINYVRWPGFSRSGRALTIEKTVGAGR